MGHAREILNWGPGFCGKEVMEWELGGSDDAESFGQVEVI